LVGQQLGIHTECAPQRAFNLGGTVVLRAQGARRAGNERLQFRNVGKRGLAQLEANADYSGRRAPA
jgi:hypothetical protein